MRKIRPGAPQCVLGRGGDTVRNFPAYTAKARIYRVTDQKQRSDTQWQFFEWSETRDIPSEQENATTNDTVLQQGGAQLSQGERHLLTIVRAVLINAPILILDEATSSVDTVTEQRIRRAMLEITKSRTSIIIAHRLSTIRDSDLILLMENGQIVEQGNHAQLMVLNGRYALMHRTQSGQLHNRAGNSYNAQKIFMEKRYRLTEPVPLLHK